MSVLKSGLAPMGALLAGAVLLLSCGETGQPGADDAQQAGMLVSTAQGKLEGEQSGQSIRFLKIPYAKPPLGALRWKAPQPADGWAGTRRERAFAEPCPQQQSQQGGGSNNEDCLYLNVWKPVHGNTKAPVMVWFHGGGNFAGSAGDKVPDPLADASQLPLFYDGQYFAGNQGVVLVSANYRLGPFGFFAHGALEAEGSPAGNQGLLDQRQVLLWVKEHIADFGGDPQNVTIFGESAGSADVCFHVVSPLSRGLFQRAISQSGGCTVSPRGSRQATRQDSQAGMARFAAALGCADPAGALSCLRGKSAADIVAHGMQPNPSGGFFNEADYSFDVVIDGPGGFLPEPARALFDRGEVAKVPYLLGSNSDEGSLFTFTTSVPDEATYLGFLRAGYGANAEQVAAQYPASKFGGDYKKALTQVIGDSGLICGTDDVARRAHAAGLPVYMYNFNVTWTVGFGTLGAAHGSEMSHVFGQPYRPDADSQRVSDAMNAYWAGFARTGDPNYAGAPASWPRYAPDAEDKTQRLQLDARFELLNDFRKAECTFWRSLYTKL